MKYLASLFLFLLAIWLLWSGHYTGLIIGFGVASCAGVSLISHRMGVVDREGAPIESLLAGLLYAPWLLWEIFKANLDVARRIVQPSLPISPTVVRVDASQRTDLGRVVHANSITLTPGTVSLAVEGQRIVVHALSREGAEELEQGAIDRRVSRFEGQP